MQTLVEKILGYTPYHGENVLWEGTPGPGAFRWRRLGGWLTVTAVMLVITWVIFLGNVAVWGLVNGIMVILTGLNLLGRVAEARAELPNARYVITNHRVIIQGGYPGVWHCTIALQDISRWSVRRTLADLLFRGTSLVITARFPGEGRRVWVPAGGNSLYGGREQPAFRGLHDAPVAAAALTEALAGARGRQYADEVTKLTRVS